MNERIKQLAVEAGGHNNISKFRGHFLPPPLDYIDPATVDLEKFAELIVRECMTIARNWEDQLEKAKLPSEADAVGIVTYRISRQFGVEE